MTPAREENAADLSAEDADARHRALADAQVARGDYGTLPEAWMDYEEWLEETGMDDSFVGDGVTMPGTAQVYEAEMRAVENARIDREAAIETDPETGALTPAAEERLKALFRSCDMDEHGGYESSRLEELAHAYPSIFEASQNAPEVDRSGMEP